MSISLLERAKIAIAGENSLMIYFGEQASAEVSAHVQQAEQLIRQHMADIIIDLVPSYASIMVMFNLLDNDHHQVRSQLRTVLKNFSSNSSEAFVAEKTNTAKVVELPVYYSPESGPDLANIAKQAELSISQVIEIHQAQEYRVYAIGFAPGFAYLGEIDKRIATPRLSSPRLKVPKGAVAIADRQTAVYPSVSPGGWNIIGLCPMDMFDASAEPVMPVQVGDKVKFKEITKTEFIALGGVLSVEGREVK
ncbi:MAG: 5-oxoprolinase subunit PxpB [Colwellia sp.]|nr:5-oxoprolinase subunit PxpB [Colwellia sp.]MCW8865583.1 5-oxoprolinase subunit PxpB [Colwellia sp.]MCW9080925.1 5-oxoprolinase subunit PxpB [Colwellia sp.]